MSENSYHCGFAAIVGRANVGKSTLLNSLLRQKVSIVTAKPQTTRHRILGISTLPDSQVVFVDTPGMHDPGGRAMNRAMNRLARQSLVDADLVLFVIEALRWSDQEDTILREILAASRPVILVVNKVDRVRPRDKLLPFIDDMAAKAEFEAIVPVSALKDPDLGQLRRLASESLPVAPPCFPAEQITDRSDAFRAAEVIREKLTAALHQELPYGLAVEIEKFEPAGRGIHMSAVIWVERSGQKAIVIGKSGNLLKRIGREARLELKARMVCPVHIDLWVKVKKNWSDSERSLRELGYELQ